MNGWMPNNAETSFQLVQESWKWLEPTFRKIGNQLSIEPVGYTKVNHTFSKEEENEYASAVNLYLEVTNHGASDQIQSDFFFSINNNQMVVLNSNSEYGSDHVLSKAEKSEDNSFFFNGLKKRSKQTVTIPVYLKKISDKPDFYDTYKGPLETVVRYREFFDETSKLKAELLNFPPLLKGSNAT